MVWQVAVDHAYRGRGLAGALLDGLWAKVAADRATTVLETTISPGNTASQRLFTSFARRNGVEVAQTVLFDAGLFPDDGHEPEVLHRIGPIV